MCYVHKTPNECVNCEYFGPQRNVLTGGKKNNIYKNEFTKANKALLKTLFDTLHFVRFGPV